MSCFITLEGIEGSGKSTLCNRLAEAIRSEKREVVVTREPGSTALGLELRNILLNHKNQGLNSVVELLLFAADRAQHVSQLINPALERGATVICDRYIHSTIAYQGYARGLEISHLSFLNEFVTCGLRPDLVLLLDLEPKLGLKRVRGRAKQRISSYQSESKAQEATTEEHLYNRLDAEPFEFHTAVRNGYLELAGDPANKMVIVDASKSQDMVFNNSLDEIKKLLT